MCLCVCVCALFVEKDLEWYTHKIFIIVTHGGNGWSGRKIGGDNTVIIIFIFILIEFYIASVSIHYFYNEKYG